VSDNNTSLPPEHATKAELAQRVAELEATVARLQQTETQFRTIVENVPSGICITNEHGTFEYVNPAYCRIYGYREEELIGQPFTIVVPKEQYQQAQELHDTFLAERREIPADWQVVNKAGAVLHIMASAAYLEEADGHARKVTFVLDISDRKRIEEQHTLLQQQLIDAQRDTLRELSTPLIPITDEVVIMPLIGTIDSQRAQQIMEALLEGTAQHQAELAILDITGVAVVDTQVAQALVSAAQAVRLLGAQVMLTGIQPQIAQTLVQLGVDLSGIQTEGSLQAGIAAALATTNHFRAHQDS
jgi:anti-anti-sigma factor